MTNQELEAALDRYGGDLTRWPEALRRDAELLAAADREAARTLAAGAALERALGASVHPMTVDAAFLGRILADIGHASGRELALRPTGRLAAWLSAAMALFLFAGFAAGLALPQSQSDDTLAGLMFGSAYADDGSSSGSVL